MAILKGFPPSNTINPTIYILDDDDPNKKCYLHTNNVWLKRKEDDQRYLRDIASMLKRMEPLGFTCNLGDSLMEYLRQVGVKASEAFQQIEVHKIYKHGFSEHAPWFVWFEYHIIHALSVQLGGEDLRGIWMKSWDWQKKDQWCQERMKEKLEDQTPLAKDLAKLYQATYWAKVEAMRANQKLASLQYLASRWKNSKSGVTSRVITPVLDPDKSKQPRFLSSI